MEDYRTRLSAEFVRSILDYDPQSGIFRWRFRPAHPARWNSRYAGTIAGTVATYGYRMIQLGADERGYRASRVAWLYMTGEWPTYQIDHINGRRDDDRWSNLRSASHSENNRNHGVRADSTIGLRGVSRLRKRFQAKITVHGKRHHLGTFDTPEAAAAAYREAAARLHGEFVRS